MSEVNKFNNGDTFTIPNDGLNELDYNISNKVLVEFREQLFMADLVVLRMLIRRVIELKNEQFNKLVEGRINDRVEEIAQERTKDINGIPVRTLVARDFVVALINKMERFTNEEVTGVAIELTDTLLKGLNQNK